LAGDALVAQAQGLFQRDLIKGVGRPLGAVGHDAGPVRLDLDADVEVHHSLVSDEDLHQLRGPWLLATARGGRVDMGPDILAEGQGRPVGKGAEAPLSWPPSVGGRVPPEAAVRGGSNVASSGRDQSRQQRRGYRERAAAGHSWSPLSLDPQGWTGWNGFSVTDGALPPGAALQDLFHCQRLLSVSRRRKRLVAAPAAAGPRVRCNGGVPCAAGRKCDRL